MHDYVLVWTGNLPKTFPPLATHNLKSWEYGLTRINYAILINESLLVGIFTGDIIVGSFIQSFLDYSDLRNTKPIVKCGIKEVCPFKLN